MDSTNVGKFQNEENLLLINVRIIKEPLTRSENKRTVPENIPETFTNIGADGIAHVGLDRDSSRRPSLLFP